MSEFIPYGRQWINDEDVAAVEAVLRGEYLTTGPAVDEFEASLALATGAKHVVAVNSGTAALHAMYFGAGIGPGDEIVTSPMTFAATANAALYLGANVRFADIELKTGNIDPERVEEQITPRTRAIVAIDFAGTPSGYDALHAVGERHGVTVLADAAHSLGATYQGRPVGSVARASSLSFHPVKHITTGEGGAVVTDDADLASAARRFRTHGITRDRAEMMGYEGPWFMEQHDLGFNYRLPDVQAALGTSQLKRLQTFVHRRRQIASVYSTELANIGGLELPTVPADTDPSWHLYVVLVNDVRRRRDFFERLRSLGLGVQVHYIPVYLHPHYRSLGFEPGTCPAAEERYARSVSIPIFPAMTDSHVESVIERIRDAARTTL